MYSEQIRNEVKTLFDGGEFTKEIAAKTGVSLRTVQRIIKEYDKKIKPEIVQDYVTYGHLWQLPENEKPEKRVYGCIADLHLPCIHENYINFLVETFDKWGVTDIMIMGDVCDMSTLSRHTPEADAPSVPNEFAQAQRWLNMLYKQFPVAKCCRGNHTQRLEKRANDGGIPAFCLKSLRELFNIPETWDIQDNYEIDGVLYTHGTQFNSRNILTMAANYASQSIVIGHQHSLLGVVYSKNIFNKESFAMCCGCGINENAYAFRYGKNAKMRPVLGCGIVLSSKEAYTVKMGEEWSESIQY